MVGHQPATRDCTETGEPAEQSTNPPALLRLRSYLYTLKRILGKTPISPNSSLVDIHLFQILLTNPDQKFLKDIAYELLIHL